jgi:hypothetical protein
MPLQGTARTLVPVGGALFRVSDRIEPSHVLAEMSDGTAISDGQRTWERVSLVRLGALWASAVAGLLGVLHLLVVGTTRTVRAYRRGDWRGEPMAWPVLVLALLVLAPTLYLTQSFMAIGDPTIANVTLAALTALLPLTTITALITRARTGMRTTGAKLDFISMLMALQWFGVLAYWNLLPLTLWR